MNIVLIKNKFIYLSLALVLSPFFAMSTATAAAKTQSAPSGYVCVACPAGPCWLSLQVWTGQIANNVQYVDASQTAILPIYNGGDSLNVYVTSGTTFRFNVGAPKNPNYSWPWIHIGDKLVFSGTTLLPFYYLHRGECQ